MPKPRGGLDLGTYLPGSSFHQAASQPAMPPTLHSPLYTLPSTPLRIQIQILQFPAAYTYLPALHKYLSSYREKGIPKYISFHISRGLQLSFWTSNVKSCLYRFHKHYKLKYLLIEQADLGSTKYAAWCMVGQLELIK